MSSPATASLQPDPRPTSPSPAQIAANRANAAKSTGPRTPAGKAKVAANAVKHGIFAESVSLAPATPRLLDSQIHGAAIPGEQLQYRADLAAFTAHLQPEGPIETRLVERLASIALRLARLTRAETGVFANGIDSAVRYGLSPAEDPAALQQSPSEVLLGQAYVLQSKPLNLLSHYEARLSREFHRVHAELDRLRSLRLSAAADQPATEPVEPPPGFAPGKTNPIAGPEPAPHPTVPAEIHHRPPVFTSDAA